MILEARDVSAGYGGAPVLDGASLSLPSGTLTALIGPNGAGKTTLLRVLLGLLPVRAGAVLLEGRPLAAASRLEVARRVALVAQEGPDAFAHTALEVVLMGRYPHRSSGWFDAPADIAAAGEALGALGVAELAERPLATLSGGQRQRVFLAAALAQEPAVMLLDEPTANLDLAAQVGVYEVVRGLVRRRGLAALAVTHDVTLAAMYADRVALLSGGRIAHAGTPAEVLRPEILTAAYGTPVAVTPHPVTGTPVVLPVPGSGR